MTELETFNFYLPPHLIAQHPLPQRQDSRMMVLDRKRRAISHHRVGELPKFLTPQDCLVLNDTKVVPARIWAQVGEKRVELLLTNRLNKTTYLCKAKPGKRLPPGVCLRFPGTTLTGQVLAPDERSTEPSGKKIIQFSGVEDISETLHRIGSVPLPPYIKREPAPADRERYQTVFARSPGAIAAPTAGLHFTAESLYSLQNRGVELLYLTLHVGEGTFAPVRSASIAEHTIHKEQYELPAFTAQRIETIRSAGGRICCIGTTSCRVLETCAIRESEKTFLRAGNGITGIFIYPPYEFKVTDLLLTNFHLPKSTLLMLVYAFAGMEFAAEAYREAITNEYRFYSYGDCMLIL